MIVEILDPRFRYNIEGLTEEQLTILSAEISPDDPLFWKNSIFTLNLRGRLLEIRVDEDGSRKYFYTQKDRSTKHILPLDLVIKSKAFDRKRRTYFHNNHKFIIL